ncbi:MAG: hypothetical protein HYV32_03325 [Candidatus Kerfeldbacteria bacterium]|nr:hypothetical protein [Candidatus Kerfeldbacteria bacterium]
MDIQFHELLQKIVREAHHTELPTALEEKMIMDLSIQLEQRLEDSIANALTPEQNMAYQQLLEAEHTQTQVLEFLHTHIPNIKKRFEETIAQFRQDYLTTVQR